MSEPVSVQPAFLMYAFRYALGARTYAVADVADTLIANVDALELDWRGQIVRDITDAIDEGRAGMDMDVRRWQEVRKAMVDAGAKVDPDWARRLAGRHDELLVLLAR